RIGGLDDEDIPPPYVFVDLDEDLAIGEAPDRHRAQRLAQMLRHLLGEGTVARPAEQQQLAARERQVRHRSPETSRQAAVSQGVGLARWPGHWWAGKLGRRPRGRRR